jgi:hypothetical protein
MRALVLGLPPAVDGFGARDALISPKPAGRAP